ncbi:ABC transporter ATP-binding protein [Herbiconiux sp. CPCC 205716]|uniref:ABC transporter ATP-binding protein n=1 Tax=Herbiconiux gentiana TaxID=2970912 RepID=A0ABT2GAF8_9MICO|nr:ABC transporter ATP-binding protein [Herbiconiux gentiana]MCS5713185.1 ABC transporter ATP-binding protein [Herbiconiux gentiana]
MTTPTPPAKTGSPATAPVLEIRDLSVEFATDSGTVRAVDHVDLTVEKGGILGLVGESGSGKSVTALCILGLIGSRRAKITSGEVRFQGEDLLTKTERQMRDVRGGRIGLVSQNALSALDPSFRIGDQLIEVIRLHQHVDKATAARIALDSLDIVALPDAARRMRSYPHELSGGQRQRVVIAIALACRPQLLIADEPTTALDATVQQQILDLLLDINKNLGTSMLMVTHDFGVVAHMCTTVAVMRKGRIVEQGEAGEIISFPRQPYTQGLMNAVPRLRLSETERAVPRSQRRLPVFVEESAFAERADYATV